MSDYEVFDEIKKPRKPFSIPGASPQLCKDIKSAIEQGVSYGTYMWLKSEKEDREYFEKYGRKRIHK